jgi:ketosteroid isomerase-like protein
MQKSLFILILVLGLAPKTKGQSGEELAIRNALNEQLAAWNSGDLNRFMSTYWQDDSLMFIGKNGITYGWHNTLEKYKKGYPDTAAMGKLDFEILNTNRLSADYCFVVGRWHLTRSIGNVGGHFTLLFRKIKSRWLIVADHSS